MLKSFIFLFIFDFKIRKPDLKMILAMIVVVSVTVGVILAYTKFRVPSYKDRENRLIERLFGDTYDEETP